MSMSFKDLKLPLLKGSDNYHDWHDAIIAYLYSQGMDSIVSGEWAKPREVPVPIGVQTRSSTANAETSALPAGAKDWMDWKEANKKALGVLWLSLSSTIRRTVIAY